MDQPSSFVLDSAARVERRSWPPRVLDVAMGSGRHALPLAERGFRVFGVDWDRQRVSTAKSAAAARGLIVNAWVADLSQTTLPVRFFDLIVCARFLDRALFPSLARALSIGGLLAYETFTTAQRAHRRGPRSPEHLLEPGELTVAFPTLTTVLYEEVDQPDAVARLLARRDA